MCAQVKGGTLLEAGRELWAQGVAAGYWFPALRFYQGVAPALLQGPLCRFGDTAANEGVLVLLHGRRLPLWAKTAVGTVAACTWRAALTPLDTLKLVLEVDGVEAGLSHLRSRVAQNGMATFFAGAVGVGVTAAVSHWPWFTVNNLLQQRLPQAASHPGQLWRAALIGFVATLCSDVVANPMRVLKVTVQTAVQPLSYRAAAAAVVAKGGATALLTRGLMAKICANALQGVVFSVLWRMLMEAYAKRRVESLSQDGGWRRSAGPRLTLPSLAPARRIGVQQPLAEHGDVEAPSAKDA
jgi:hypothetical protein